MSTGKRLLKLSNPYPGDELNCFVDFVVIYDNSNLYEQIKAHSLRDFSGIGHGLFAEQSPLPKYPYLGSQFE